MQSNTPNFKNWTLFLDRDGVINTRIPGRYVIHWDQFKFTKGALSAISNFRHVFAKIFVVTNQQGVSKGILSKEQLEKLHEMMLQDIVQHDGWIDKVYYAPQLVEENSIDRKPGPGMAIRAKQEFPMINFEQSVMVGDSMSDMIFGKELGMYTVLVSGKEEEKDTLDESYIDLKIQSLANFLDFI